MQQHWGVVSCVCVFSWTDRVSDSSVSLFSAQKTVTMDAGVEPRVFGEARGEVFMSVAPDWFYNRPSCICKTSATWCTDEEARAVVSTMCVG